MQMTSYELQGLHTPRSQDMEMTNDPGTAVMSSS